MCSGVCVHVLQVYEAQYEALRVQYKAELQDFLQSLGGSEAQEAYLADLKKFNSQIRQHRKQCRLRKNNLIKVTITCMREEE